MVKNEMASGSDVNGESISCMAMAWRVKISLGNRRESGI